MEKRLKDRSGRRPKRRHSTRSTTSAASPTSIGSARAARRCGSTTWRRTRRSGARSAGTPSSSTATTSTRCSMRYAEARTTPGRPTMILARTFKGQGIPAIEGKDGWHGKPLKKGEEADAAVRSWRRSTSRWRQTPCSNCLPPSPSRPGRARACVATRCAAAAYKLGDSVATREAYGLGAGTLGAVDARIVVLDADVRNSTFSEKFEKPLPDRFYQMLHRRAGDGRGRDGACRHAARSRSRRPSRAF